MFLIDKSFAAASSSGLSDPENRLHMLPKALRPYRIRCLLRLAFGSVILISALGAGYAKAEEIPTVNAPAILYFPNANSRPTYFTIHNVYDAWSISKGAGVKVGILDHSFGYDVHPGLYAGGKNFQKGGWGESFNDFSHHGFWMASTLREIAPEVEIYALGTYSSDASEKVDAMVQAIDWAITRDLDVLTYSAVRFPPETRKRLDSAVDRALAKGIVTTFIHYPHPGNLLPTGLLGRTGDDERDPDVNILHYDYSVIFTKQYVDWMKSDKSRLSKNPFLSISSTSPVTAGFVALLKSVQPDLKPAEVKQVLMETSRATVFEGRQSPRTVDIAAAIRSVTKPAETQ
ncbi:MAG: peptidase [Planctomycetes bacterium B3_Pla]|nr:MAG: peptidase [Planctomycetes bacterium B3_Pla]